ncbi:hypothetical protein DPX16_0751 [Anabarilius grahami]|uniref:Uncharacterized protein n=1 Tax=Anabarilius grahami TaxID=495550 RepID=A0A3N0XZX4_ANAGA|nr:hypothetical protein DPX16_0751 [Anabarilius grahami]
MKQSRAECCASRNEAAGVIAKERRVRHMAREQQKFYYATVATSASSSQAYVGGIEDERANKGTQQRRDYCLQPHLPAHAPEHAADPEAFPEHAAGPEAFPEHAVGPEATPEVLESNASPVIPDMAKKTVFVFYVLTVLRAWRTHVGSGDHGPEQPEPAAVVPEQPEPAAVPEQPALPDTATEAVTELPALPDTATEAVTELPALPDMATEHPWSALPPPRPSEPLKPAKSVPPAPPWQSARTPTFMESPWPVESLLLASNLGASVRRIV